MLSRHIHVSEDGKSAFVHDMLNCTLNYYESQRKLQRLVGPAGAQLCQMQGRRAQSGECEGLKYRS